MPYTDDPFFPSNPIGFKDVLKWSMLQICIKIYNVIILEVVYKYCQDREKGKVKPNQNQRSLACLILMRITLIRLSPHISPLKLCVLSQVVNRYGHLNKSSTRADYTKGYAVTSLRIAQSNQYLVFQFEVLKQKLG
jgi:hypothetical protein